MNCLTLANKVLKDGYFWMTIEHDYCRFVQKRYKCKLHGDLIRVPPHELNVMGSPWTLVSWGMDVIDPIELDASNGHWFILVAIDNFTKWVKENSYKFVTKKVTVDFIPIKLIWWFGLLDSIITDNCANLNSHLMKEICEQFKITHWKFTAYCPQMNWAVEAANKNMKRFWERSLTITKVGMIFYHMFC